MIKINKLSLRFLRHRAIVPAELKANFRNLYFDIAWFGILNGTILSFLSVFATRANATSQQIGFLGAAPAIANLIFSLPASVIIQKLPTARSVFLSALLQRIFYFVIALLPFFLESQGLIWTIIILTFIMSIPGSALAVGVNALIAETVPVEWRGHVVGNRNAILSLSTIGALFISGQILSSVVYPLNYQIIFFIGFLGAMMSCAHLSLIKTRKPAVKKEAAVDDPAVKTEKPRNYVRADIRKKMTQANRRPKLNLKTIQGKYGWIIFMLFLFNFALFLSVPLFPVYQVNVLGLTDRVISLGSSFFQVTVFMGSLQIGKLARKFGNHRLTGIGLASLVTYPLLLPLSKTPLIFLLVSASTGVAWAMINGCLVNYLLEQIPTDDLAGHLAWYNVALNAAILLGSLLGPIIAGFTGLTVALIIFAFGRLLSGLVFLRWGK